MGILTAITFLPLVGAVVCFLTRGPSAKNIALVFALLTFAISLFLWPMYDVGVHGVRGWETFQLTEGPYLWVPDLGITYFLGVDGIAVLLIVLTTLISVVSVIWSWDTIKVRQREYYIAILLLETGMLGVFMALDLFVFYIFWEVMLIPMALLIGVWGSSNRVYAAVKFFIYTLFGSLLMLVGIVAPYQAYADKTPMKRWATADEMAGPTVFLLSDAASYVTGTILFADGGWLANDGRFTPPGI